MIRGLQILGLLFGVLLLAGCDNNPQPYATDEQVAGARYVSDAPPSITLITMINNTTGAGGHTSLLINASEQVMFDPAGSFYYHSVPERNDVLFGMSPAIVQGYRSSQARAAFHVWSQKIEVSPEVAEQAYNLALSNGRVAPALCANATSQLLQKLPGFESLRTTWFPENLAEQFSHLPGVEQDRYYEDDDVTYAEALAAANAAGLANQ